MHHTLRPHVWSRVKEPMVAKGLLQSRRPASPARIFASGVKLPAWQPIFVSDQVTRDAAGEIMGRGAVRAQTRQTPGNLRAVLGAGEFKSLAPDRLVGTEAIAVAPRMSTA